MIRIGWAAGLLAVALAVAYYSVPLRQPDWVLRRAMLARTPLGTPLEDIERQIASGTYPLVRREFAPLRVLEVELGSYSVPARTVVTCTWLFDAGGRLLDVDIGRRRVPKVDGASSRRDSV